ncbi:hypothetical protein [Streptomyces beihaiensis]|uniref:Integral membrane protein n=1 Tax=Streptomyces beihaiensis TaxID=2984495 RepID=A0ABT3U3Z0_9ACTN|nr:hypothetical protein [Streptomyces beihaiensis]MCX3064026.1 hypothetical protein [Streptomyces beihaiensis]
MADTVSGSGASRARTRADRWARLGGPAAGVLLSVWVGENTGSLGVGLLSAIPAFGLCAVGGVLLGEYVTARPRGPVRTAGLAPRRVRDHVPPRLTAVLVVEAVLLVVLLGVTTALGSADDMGRAGRELSMTCSGVTEAYGPWPGSFYAGPVLASVALASLACGYALRRITRRAGEDQERRERASAITAAWGLAVSVPLAGAALTAAGALRGMSCDGAVGSVAVWVLLPVSAIALGTAVRCLVAASVPNRASR